MPARVPRLKYVCLFCGKAFLDRAKKKRKYCSRECAGKAHSKSAKRITRTCDHCRHRFTTPDPSNWDARHQQRFCSSVCKGKGIAQERGLRLRKTTTFICEHCKQPFTRVARIDRDYHYCGLKCFHAHHRGENHHCWQGGAERYYGPNWEQQRRFALIRDEYRCQHCGIENVTMSVHHIVPRSAFGMDWQAMNALSNLISLCSPCHTRLHHQIAHTMPLVGSSEGFQIGGA